MRINILKNISEFINLRLIHWKRTTNNKIDIILSSMYKKKIQIQQIGNEKLDMQEIENI